MIQVELGPEMEEAIAAGAKQRDMSTADYIKSLMSTALPPVAKHRTLAELEQTIQELAELGRGAPVLSEYAMTRESFYEGEAERVLGL